MGADGAAVGACAGGLVSLCNTGPLGVRKQIVCIHDANTRNYPESYSRAFRSLYRMLMPAIGSAARQVATVSHFSAGELARFGIAKPRKIFVAPNGHEHAARWSRAIPPRRAAPPGRGRSCSSAATRPTRTPG